MKVILDRKDISAAVSLWGAHYHPEWIGKSCDWWACINGDEITLELELMDERPPAEMKP